MNAEMRNQAEDKDGLRQKAVYENTKKGNAYEAFLTSVGSLMEAEILMGLLQSEGIPVRKKHNFSGDYLEVFSNFTPFGVDLFVPPSEWERAMELISAPVEISEHDVFEKGNRELSEKDYVKNDGSFRRKAMKIMIIAGIAVAAAAGLWTTFFIN